MFSDPALQIFNNIDKFIWRTLKGGYVDNSRIISDKHVKIIQGNMKEMGQRGLLSERKMITELQPKE